MNCSLVLLDLVHVRTCSTGNIIYEEGGYGSRPEYVRRVSIPLDSIRSKVGESRLARTSPLRSAPLASEFHSETTWQFFAFSHSGYLDLLRRVASVLRQIVLRRLRVVG